MSKHIYGWKPDVFDPRDFGYKVTAPVTLQTVHLKDKYKMPPIFNQLRLGSCTGNGGAYSTAFNILNNLVQNKDVKCDLPFSRLFIYGNARKIEGTFNQDSGAQIRDVLKSIASEGVCSETLWPYDINKFAEEPYSACYVEALKFRAIKYSRLNNLSRQELVGSLLDGLPFILGFTVFESFESDRVAKTGIVQMPGKNERTMGGHCTVGVGYDAPSDRFTVANSWGEEWGLDGYFTIPADYLCSKLANDFWNIATLL
jgi:C1A family cysteine protease